MAEEEAKPEVKKEDGKGGVIRWIGALLGVVLIMSIAALLLFKFVIAPGLTNDNPTDPTDPPIDPAAITAYTFDEAYAAVQTGDEDIPVTLMYQVTLECSNATSAEFLKNHKARFTHMIRVLHSNRTQEELEDLSVQESMRKQAVQKANEIIMDLQGEPLPENRVLNLYYDKFYVAPNY